MESGKVLITLYNTDLIKSYIYIYFSKLPVLSKGTKGFLN